MLPSLSFSVTMADVSPPATPRRCYLIAELRARGPMLFHPPSVRAADAEPTCAPSDRRETRELLSCLPFTVLPRGESRYTAFTPYSAHTGTVLGTQTELT